MTADLTMALERYDRHVPFFMGMVASPPGLAIRALEVGMAPPRRDGVDRHRRFLLRGEFDICEMSVSSYLTAKDRGLPFTAVPVFPRRLFSQNHMFVSARSGVTGPKDLEGKRVCARAFQTTMSVLAKGDLKFEYGVAWETMRWQTLDDELNPWPGKDGVAVERIDEEPAMQDFIAGDIALMIHPHPPHALLEGLARGTVRRLFPDTRAECARYFRKYGDYPIMHVLAMKDAVAAAHPGLPRALMAMWDDARDQAAGFYDDPGYAELAFARNAFEEEQQLFGRNPWVTGLAANRASVERFMTYLADQNLIRAPYAVESLFHESVLDT
jgi:4,5-dihydroxyphthalate decarboxylase